jgi:hypothetical protein
MSGVRLGLVLFARDEQHIIEEWVAHHVNLGFERIHIFDHMSVDSTRYRIERMQANLGMTLSAEYYDEQTLAQPRCYDLGLKMMTQEGIDWCAFIDTDEFIAPPTGTETLADMLEHTHAQHCAVALNWAVFGSDGHIEQPPGLIQDNFLHRAQDDFPPHRLIKSIVRPQYTMGAHNSHGFSLDHPYYTAAGEPVIWDENLPTRAIRNPIDLTGWRINHYFCQWRQRWDAKVARSKKRGKDGTVRSEADWRHHDRNEVFDPAALAWTGRDAETLKRITA